MRLGIGEFEIKDKDLAGRIGRLQTPSGTVETPALFPVIDIARQEVPVEEVRRAGFNQVITNAYLLWRRGFRGRVHEALGFEGVVMTDSGAYQILRYGSVEIGPREVVEYQKAIGSDIAVILDYPTGNARTRSQAEYSVEETLRRARESLSYIDPGERVWVLPVQGGEFLDLVEKSALGARDLTGYSMYALGSPTVHMERYNYSVLFDMIYTARRHLPLSRPLHLFGAGHPMVIPFAVALGVDSFDSASYILYARDNRYMTETRTYRLEDMDYFPCNCPVCRKYTPKELMEMPKPERTRLLALHNLYVLAKTIAEVKLAIREGRLWELLEERSRAHPLLYSGFKRFQRYSEWLSKISPVVKGGEVHGVFLYGEESLWRPQLLQHQKSLLEKYRPPSYEKLVLIPADAAAKPLTVSEKYRAYRGREGNAHIAFYVPFIGVIPEELAETYPLTHFEIPERPGHEVLAETARRIVEYLAKHVDRYREVVMLVNGGAEWSSKLSRLVEEAADREGIGASIKLVVEHR